MSGTLQASIVKDSASSTNNLALDSSGNVTVGNNLTVSGTGNTSFSGNVGIGGAASVKLEVYGETRISGGVASGAILSLTSSSTGSSGITIESTYYTGTYGPLIFKTGGSERMRIDTSGNLLVGTTSANGRVTIKTASNAAATGFSIVNSGSVALFNIREDGVFYTGLAPNSPYNLTSGSAANMVVDSAGGVSRSTSSLRYKQNVQDYGKGLTDLAKLRPVTFNSKPVEGRDPDTHTYAGFIAEEVDAAGLTEFVQYNAENQPDALAYPNMVALLTKSLQEAVAKIDVLETRITQLESK